MEERIQRGQGPSIFQPYRGLWKLFHKTLLIPVLAISYDIYMIDEARILEYFGPLLALLV
ncbi:MAG: hypothetical protein ACYDB0_05165 [Acidithiobacillus sp.]|jgi:formate hydrogenlyase subunit 4